MSDWRDAIDAHIETHADDLVAARRHLHAHPEPSNQESETAGYLADILARAGLPSRLIASGHGLVAGPCLDSDQPRVAFRADIDALHIHDLKDVPYRSLRDGLMHACGHDAHATMALGAALALWQCRDALPHPVPWQVLFQPAEETGQGAIEMIAAGAVDHVRALVALHVNPESLVGEVSVRSGVMTAFCQDLTVVIRGLAGHAARPHQARDPIAAAAQFLTAAYQAVPRSVDAREASVVTFGVIHGGKSPNAIPDHVTLRGTIRTLSDDARIQVEQRLRALAAGLAPALEVAIDVTIDHGLAGVINDPAVTAICVQAAAEVVGPAHVVDIPLPSMGAEDFSSYRERVPGCCFLRVGVASETRPRHLLHTPHFDIDERSLLVGARLLAHAMVHLAGSFL